MHIVLVGDSIFDNAAYTGAQPDVVSHLRSLLPRTSTATLCAVDGATVSGITAQLARVPGTATHIVISIGGNDALRNADLLNLPVSTSAEALQQFATRVNAFERAYRTAVTQVLALERTTVLCTIYNGRLSADVAAIARVGLTLFNDAILRTAFELRVDAIELRSVCDEPSDYANPIEPSGSGGLKIARAIVRAVGGGGGDGSASRVWA